MVKDIGSYMDGSEQAFEDVLAACDDLINAKVILSETKVATLLQKIAGSSRAYALFDRVLKGFDFNYEFTLAKQRNALGTYSLALPNDNRRLAAFVLCLLIEFDTTSCDLMSFLDVYFYGGDPAKQFAHFANDMLIPFKEAITELYYDGGLLDGGQSKESLPGGESSGAPQLPVGNATNLDSLFADLALLSEKLGTAELGAGDFDDAALTLDGLSRALASADRDGIRLAYTALKRTVSALDALSILDDDVLNFGKKLVGLGAIPSV